MNDPGTPERMTETAPAEGASAAAGSRPGKAQSLGALISIAVIGATVSIALGIGFTSTYFFRNQAIDNSRETLGYEASLHATALSERLSATVDSFRFLLNNPILFNALIDSAGRETYLRPLLEGVTNARRQDIQIGLLDFSGTLILETKPVLATQEARDWMKERLRIGQDAATILTDGDDHRLLLLGMLRYDRSNTVEGILAISLSLKSLMAAIDFPNPDHRPDDLIYGLEGMSVAHSGKAMVKNDLTSLFAVQKLSVPAELAPLDLRVRVSDDGKSLVATLNKLWQTSLAIGLLALIAAGLFGWIIGQRLVSSLAGLRDFATSVAQSQALDARAPATGPSEVQALAHAFNDVLSRLSQAQSDTEENLQRLASLIGAMPDQVGILDSNGRVIDVLSLGAAPLESGLDPVGGKKRVGRLALPTGKEMEDLRRRLRKTRSIEIVEFPMSETDGTLRWFIGRAAPLASRDGTGRHFVWVAQDITRQRGAEVQLRQAQKMEAVGQLSGGIAHDFNNLLAVIVGNLDLLRAHLEENRAGAKLLEKSISAAERGASLTSRLLAFARQQTLQPTAIVISRQIKDTSQLLSRALGESIRLAVDCPDDVWPIHVDLSQFESSLINLAINARDAMPNGGRLTISTVNETIDMHRPDIELNPGQYVVISIADTGTGIPPEILSRVFDPFFTTKDFGKGSGLGLSMVLGFAQQSGGSVKIESAPDIGTIVHLYLPRWTGIMPELGREKSTRQLAGSGIGQRLLLVEDNDDLRSMTLEQVRSLGYHAIGAANAAEALDAIGKEGEIDLMLTDIVLGSGMNGVQLADTARQKIPGLKILFMTGYATADTSREIGEVDPLLLLRKPFRLRELSERLASLAEMASV